MAKSLDPAAKLLATSSSSRTEKKPELARELPPFTAKNVALDIVNGAWALIYEPQACRVVVPVLVFLLSMVCKYIVSHVPYTEIDFSTYMQQVEMVNGGALDYATIMGDSGPIVYPAGFVQVYQALYWLTDGGENLRLAQLAFGYLFSAGVALTCMVYTMTGNFPPWPLYLLVCSRRLYSIYVLRMFNDCFTVVGVLAVILILQLAAYYRQHLSGVATFALCAVAADVFSLALSVKMNVLLYLPAFVVVVYFLMGERVFHCLAVVLVIPLVQTLVGWRFLLPLFWDEEAAYLRHTYLTRAFDFSRRFLHTWTVNWRFVPEHVFASDKFAHGLLLAHVAVLLFFILTRFVSPRLTQKSVGQLVKDAVLRPFTNTVSPGNLLLKPESGPRLILLIFAATNLTGILFARSLHYQFLAWYQWLLPFLLHAAEFNIFTGTLIFAAHEWCWNVFPSTNESSQLLVAILAVVLFGTWYNADYWYGTAAEKLEDKK